jgi:hypothetical protein
MTTRSAAWLIPFALLAVDACSSSSNNGTPRATPDAPPAPVDAAPNPADAVPDAPPDAPPAPAVLVASPATLDIGAVPVGSQRMATVEIKNQSTAAVTLSPVTVSAPFSIQAQNCTTTLAAGAMCFVNVAVTPAAVGPLTGTLTLPSSANTLTVPLTAGGGFTLSARVNADGAQVVSDPAGIAQLPPFPTVFQGVFSTAVTLTAIPPPGGTFLGWDPACGNGGLTCVVPVPGPGASGTVAVMARFQPSLQLGPKVTVNATGGTPGLIFIVDQTTGKTLTTCVGSACGASVPAGDHVTLSAFTPSQFGGWTGDCVSTTHDCDLGTVTADRAVSVAFNRDPQELATFLSGDIAHAVAFTPDGALYLAYLDVRKVGLDGTIIWRAPVAGAHDLASDAAGNVYGVDGVGDVFSLSPTGAARWNKPVAFATATSKTSGVQVSSDGAVVAVRTTDGARVFDGSGNDLFAITGVTGADGFALAADGTLAIGEPAKAVNRRDIHRWKRDGTALPTLASLPGNTDVSLAFDAGDAVCGLTVGFGVETVSRTLSTATLAFKSSALTGFSNIDPLSALGVDSDGSLVVARSTDPTFDASGVHFDAFSPTGTKTFTLEKKASTQPEPVLVFDGVQIQSFAVDPRSHRIAVVGLYSDIYGWVEVLDMPAAP